MITISPPPKKTNKTTLLTSVRELPADLDTPVSVYMRLMGHGPSFMLESVTGGEQIARYSFIGVNPSKAIILRGHDVEYHHFNGKNTIETKKLPPDTIPFEAIREEMAKHQTQPEQEATDTLTGGGIPRFSGGFVGYMGYETIRFFEPTVKLRPHDKFPDAIFLHADTLVAFDHAFGRLLLITNVEMNGNLDEARQEAEERLDVLEERLAAPLPTLDTAEANGLSSELVSNVTPEEFIQAVRDAKEHITAGDIFQVVLSQRLSRETTAHPFQIYRTLRRLNPSPYMYFFDFGEIAGEEPMRLIGASPEMHVRLEGEIASLRPIAGTRPRGATTSEDNAFEKELLADPKERAEHVMLIDLARNDLGRVCEYGTVHVPEQMGIERYSHVMHIVSQTEGKLREGMDAFDLMKATFPAGTVSGAPKIRAMQIIDKLEPDPRGPYAGAVGYFSYDGSSDTCIAIRTLTMLGQKVSVQAGAGIVADSDPEVEFVESMNKAKALAIAVEMAEQGK